MLWKMVLVFLVMTVVDSIWALYIRSVNGCKPVRAGIWSAMILLCGSFVTVNYVHNPLMVFPAALGAFLGTYLMTRRKNG